MRFNDVRTLSSGLAGLGMQAQAQPSSTDAHQSLGALAAGQQTSAITRLVWGQGQTHESHPLEEKA